jgi:hypothetical protein
MSRLPNSIKLPVDISRLQWLSVKWPCLSTTITLLVVIRDDDERDDYPKARLLSFQSPEVTARQIKFYWPQIAVVLKKSFASLFKLLRYDSSCTALQKETVSPPNPLQLCTMSQKGSFFIHTDVRSWNLSWILAFICGYWNINHLTPNGHFSVRTSPLT